MTNETTEFGYQDEDGVAEAITFEVITPPKTGDTYYFFYSISNSHTPLAIGTGVWGKMADHDNMRFKSGNFFNTHDQASLALGFFVGILQSRLP